MKTISNNNLKPNINTGTKIKYDQVRGANFLLLPERVVKLNDSANEILRLCNGTMTINEIIKALENKFCVDNIADDILAFLNEAIGHGWITI